MASPSEISLEIETPIPCKPKRRSSIFRPNVTECTLHYNDELFPPNYKNELLQENVKWNEAYSIVKSEYLQLRNKDHCRLQHVPPVNLIDCDRYLRRAKHFCCQVNTMVELHSDVINYLDIRRRELKSQLEATSETIHEKLNV